MNRKVPHILTFSRGIGKTAKNNLSNLWESIILGEVNLHYEQIHLQFISIEQFTKKEGEQHERNYEGNDNR